MGQFEKGFFKEDGTPNRMKYKNEKGEIVEGTVEEIVRHQILNSGAGKNAGATISLSTNEDDPNGIIFHNISNKTQVGDQISHSTPAQEKAKKMKAIDELEKHGTIDKKQAVTKAKEFLRSINEPDDIKISVWYRDYES